MGRRAFVIAVGVSFLLSGCLGAPDPEAAWPPQAEPTGDPRFDERVLYLDAMGALVPDMPKAGAIAAGDFVLRWMSGEGEHPLATGPGGSLVAPENVVVTLWIETELPVLPAEPVLPDVAAWFGADGHTPIVASTRVGPLLPDTPVEAMITLGKPERQGVLESRERLDLLVTVTMTQLDESGVRILTGPEHPSRVMFRAAQASLLALPDAREREDIAGAVPLPDRVIGSLPEPGLNYLDVPVRVQENASHLQIDVDGTQGGHTVDVDIVLRDEAGRAVSWGVTPYPRETILVQGAGLEPYRGATLTLRVANHFGAAMEFTGSIEQV